MEACPVCGTFFEVEELVAHVEIHFLENEQHGSGPKDFHNVRDTDDDIELVYCPYGCGEMVSLKDLDEHEEGHLMEELQQKIHAEDKAAATAAEREEFARLQAKYGFSDKRPGKCFTCGQEGHWSNDCPNSAKKAAARERAGLQMHSVMRSELCAQQQPEPFLQVHGGLIQLLADCLRSQTGPFAVTAYLAGHVDHMCSGPFDRGFGCGWRNIQMLVSHLLLRSPQQRAALFDGCGFVPTIGALEAWLEIAWQDGFDAAGAEQLGRQVRGTRKWIGTTEAAALLRYFGIQAHFVDFIDASTTRTADGQVVHTGVECDVCGALPIIGRRHKSTKRADYDVCDRCSGSHAALEAAPFFEVATGPAPAAGGLPGSNGAPRSADGYQRHRALVNWVWGYFTGALAPPPGGPPPPRPQPQQDAAAGSSAAGVHITGLPPLYFQHEGHSRTIAGIERRTPRGGGLDEFNLLVLDPGIPTATMEPCLRSGRQWQRHVKRGVHTLRKAEYQLLYVVDGMATGAERDALKVLHTSDRIT